MDPEQVEEFCALRDELYAELSRGERSGGRGKRICQLLILPSFENAVSWQVLEARSRREPAKLCLHRSVWRMDLDLEAFRSPVERLRHARPYTLTMESGRVPIDDQRFEAILARLSTIRVPLCLSEQPWGTDGSGYELTFRNGFCHAQIHWWCSLPQEWEELSPVIDELQTLFEASWAQGRGSS